MAKNSLTDKQTKPVTVLGKTFTSEEERRTYFREELRKKLPELKKMEGFPIGEDEDILNLSDPPYYTACPNPWLNDFVNEWEEEKKELEKQGRRKADFEVTEPYAADISEGKNNPIYMAHSYHTKVPHPAIMRYLMHYTQPGDIVYDGFAGTGMTGVAASMCKNPSSIGLFENAGTRNAILNDLSPLASFIASNYNSAYSIDRLELIKEKLISLKAELAWVYKTKHSDGKYGIIDTTIWSEVYQCDVCPKEFTYWESAVSLERNKILEKFNCPNCGAVHTKSSLSPVMETVFIPEKDKSKRSLKLVPVIIKYSFEGKRYEKSPDDLDLKVIQKINNLSLQSFQLDQISVGDEISRLSKHGIESGREVFFRRSRLVIEEIETKIGRDALFLVTAISQNSSMLYRFRLNGKGGTTSGTYYICSTPQENNVFNSIKKKEKDIKKALRLIDENQLIMTGSASETAIKRDVIDYIFTDPPFGSNLMYSELNLMMETWLRVLTNNKEEAVTSRAQNKTIFEYQNLMSSCFKENYRILKPGKWMTVEFSNTSASIWNSIQTAIQNSGFIIANVTALDKKQGSFKAVNTVTAVKQDLVISCYKPSSKFDKKFNQNQNSNVSVWAFIEEHLNHLPIHLLEGNATTAIIERSPKILFDRLIAFYVQRSLPVPIDAGKFQKELRERFIERDGMFFTNEQVQEYDKKKKENPEFIQLSLLVSSEQDGVLWLKNFLVDKALTYQDIQPHWMQALAGVRKGDVIPELATILEENFLKDQAGKWYAPDPENEADLEKLRKGRLLRLFEGYKKEIENPRTKIKEVRVEALREGFKQCYQDKDFKTIVNIGDRIPNNLLMEDEVLLQFYDIASNRV